MVRQSRNRITASCTDITRGLSLFTLMSCRFFLVVERQGEVGRQDQRRGQKDDRRRDQRQNRLARSQPGRRSRRVQGQEKGGELSFSVLPRCSIFFLFIPIDWTCDCCSSSFSYRLLSIIPACKFKAIYFYEKEQYFITSYS